LISGSATALWETPGFSCGAMAALLHQTQDRFSWV
jgi:hypothetical protein